MAKAQVSKTYNPIHFEDLKERLGRGGNKNCGR